MTRLHTFNTVLTKPRATKSYITLSALLMACAISTGCTTNYLTNSTQGTYGVPVTERTIPQRLLDRSIEHTAKVNIYGLQENLQQNSRISIDSFYSEVLLSGEVPTEALKTQIEKVVSSMPDVRRVYNELNVSVAKGYSSTVHDGYITSKLMAKAAANDGVRASQVKAITNDGVVYIMGRLTPTQQSRLIDIANSTVGITELVLLTTVVNDRGLPIDEEDIMSESSAVDPTSIQPSSAQPFVAAPVLRDIAPAPAPNTVPQANPAPVEPTTDSVPANQDNQNSSSPYVDLYSD